MIDPDKLPEKQKIELATARAFLAIFNQMKNTQYEPDEVADSPDIRCRDLSTGNALDLEITLLEDRPDDIAYVLGRVDIADELSIHLLLTSEGTSFPV